MKEIDKRLDALEKQIHFRKNEVCVLHQTEDGSWQMRINGKEKFYNTEAEARADYEKNTGKDSVLIIWDI